MRPWRLLAATSVLLSAFSILLSVLLFVRATDQSATIRHNQGNICRIQGTVFAVGLANLGLALQEADFLQRHARDPEIRGYYAKVAPALRTTLDATFVHPPHCGQKFTFTIQIQGEKTRHVVTH